jgi:predicted nucleotidyltransferase
MTTTKETALNNEILRGVVGSTALGTALEGTDDRDEMGVFIEPARNVCGLTPCDHYIYRDKPEGVRSEAGDLALTIYSLRKYCRLAAQGNPSVLLLLWLPEYLVQTPLGADLVAGRQVFVSREAGQRFLGYLVSQRMKLKGEKSHTVNRPELIERYGYDTKFAMHALRLGLQGIEMMQTRNLVLPIPEPDRSTLMAIRTGKLNYNEALALIDGTETKLRALVEDFPVKNADFEAINDFMVRAHTRHW